MSFGKALISQDQGVFFFAPQIVPMGGKVGPGMIATENGDSVFFFWDRSVAKIILKRLKMSSLPVWSIIQDLLDHSVLPKESSFDVCELEDPTGCLTGFFTKNHSVIVDHLVRRFEVRAGMVAFNTVCDKHQKPTITLLTYVKDSGAAHTHIFSSDKQMCAFQKRESDSGLLRSIPHLQKGLRREIGRLPEISDVEEIHVWSSGQTVGGAFLFFSQLLSIQNLLLDQGIDPGSDHARFILSLA